MPGRTTLTVRLDPKVEERLGRLSDATQRTRSHLVAEAIAVYVARETQIVDGIHRGLADLEEGRLVLHSAAMAEVDAEIEGVARRCE